jgi:transcription antitermination protein NusB
MLNRRKARELALQVLFAWDAHGENDLAMAQQVIEGNEDALSRAALQFAGGAWSNREVADNWVLRLAPQWPPRRQPGVDRNILRLAVWELTHTETPPKVVIDEAIELAKNYSTEQSPSFVNGVLDAVLKEVKTLTEEKPGASSQKPE